jgi:hypothetical protein
MPRTVIARLVRTTYSRTGRDMWLGGQAGIKSDFY